MLGGLDDLTCYTGYEEIGFGGHNLRWYSWLVVYFGVVSRIRELVSLLCSQPWFIRSRSYLYVPSRLQLSTANQNNDWLTLTRRGMCLSF